MSLRLSAEAEHILSFTTDTFLSLFVSILQLKRKTKTKSTPLPNHIYYSPKSTFHYILKQFLQRETTKDSSLTHFSVEKKRIHYLNTHSKSSRNLESIISFLKYGSNDILHEK